MLTIGRRIVRPGDILTRRIIHETFGGQRQGGISTPRLHPIVLLFTGDTGTPYGYSDGWIDGDRVFRYFGEGQQGDMPWARGNVAVRDHTLLGRELHLFKATKGGLIQYIDQMDCGSWEFHDNTPDLTGRPRRAIVFHLVRHGDVDLDESEESAVNLQEQPLSMLRRLALEQPTRASDPKQATRNVYLRSWAVAEYVRRRSSGTCEGCHSAAPFLTKDGRPYLECHHTTRLSDGGPDQPANVVAICPNCHRRAHFGEDGNAYNSALQTVAQEAER